MWHTILGPGTYQHRGDVDEKGVTGTVEEVSDSEMIGSLNCLKLWVPFYASGTFIAPLFYSRDYWRENSH